MDEIHVYEDTLNEEHESEQNTADLDKQIHYGRGDKTMEPIIRETEVKSVLTRSNLPVSDYSVNPYVGCTHACKYCYASFMKRLE